MNQSDLRGTLLTTSSALALLVGVGGSAWAQCASNNVSPPINNAGTINCITFNNQTAGGVFTGATNFSGNVVNSGTLQPTGANNNFPTGVAGTDAGISVIGPGVTLTGNITNTGTITGTITQYAGINIGGGGGGSGAPGATVVGSIINAASITGIHQGILVNGVGTVVTGSVINRTGASITNSPTSGGPGMSVSNHASIGGSLINNGIINTGGTGLQVEGATVAGDVSNGGAITIHNGFTAMALVNGTEGPGSVGGSVINTGTIVNLNATANIALWLEGQTIGGGITNTGSITGGWGIYVSAFSNGALGGATVGGNITNNGTIVATSNSGLGIHGATVRGSVINSGSINAPAGGGIVLGTTSGVTAKGSIAGGIVNSGTITAKTGIMVTGGSTLVGGITNTGSITGTRAAIDLTGAATAITIDQMAGSITGNILLSPNGDTLNISGGTLAGNVIGANNATGGTVNFALGSGTFTTGGTFDVASININSGTVVLANDATVFGALTNNATMQVNIAGGLRTITGNYKQTSGGTLAMEVSPTGSAQLNVTKAATLSGALSLLYDPGSYTAKTYTLIQAASITGSFSQITGTVPTPGLSQTVAVGTTQVQLALGGSPITVAPANSTAGPATTTLLVENFGEVIELLFDQIDSRFGLDNGTSAGSGYGTGLASLAPPAGMQMQLASLGSNSNISAIEQVAQALPQAITDNGGWFRGIGSFASVTGRGTAPGFSGDSGGFMAGFDRPIWPNLYAGIAGGYAHTDMNQTGSTGGVDTGRVMVYGGGLLGSGIWAATAGYAHDSISTDRDIVGIGTAAESHGGNEFTAGGQWSLPMKVAGIDGGIATLTPKIGAMFLNLSEGSFAESGATGFDLSSNGHSTDSFQPFIGLAASQTFLTSGGTQITPEARLGYNRELANDNRVLNVTAVSGTTFLVQGVKPSRDMLSAGLGVTVRAQDSLYFYANYDTIVHTGNTSVQTVSAGLRLRF